MKILKAENNQGHFLNKDADFSPIDQITKEDLLRLADLVLEQDDVEFDPYADEVIKNEAHRILYKNILEKLEELQGRREEFVEQRNRLYREAYEKYQQDLSGTDGEGDAKAAEPAKPSSSSKRPLERSQPEPPSDDDIPF